MWRVERVEGRRATTTATPTATATVRSSALKRLGQAAGGRLGDIAQAYVIGHELGHHVPTLLGLTHQKAAGDRRDPGGANEL